MDFFRRKYETASDGKEVNCRQDRRSIVFRKAGIKTGKKPLVQIESTAGFLFLVRSITRFV